MAVDCDPDALANVARCWMGLSEAQLDAVAVLFVCDIVNGDAPECDPDTAAEEATCLTAGLDEQQKMAALVDLTCQWSNL